MLSVYYSRSPAASKAFFRSVKVCRRMSFPFTRKTVETHLGRVYRKLDISGRGKLAHALDEPSS